MTQKILGVGAGYKVAHGGRSRRLGRGVDIHSYELCGSIIFGGEGGRSIGYSRNG